jgi:hypothetical protein
MGASGSSQISAKLFVPDGALSHARGGETSDPSQLYLAGIIPPWPNTILFRSMAYPPLGLKNSMAARHTKVHDIHPRMRTSAIHNNPTRRFFKIAVLFHDFFYIFILTRAWVYV